MWNNWVAEGPLWVDNRFFKDDRRSQAFQTDWFGNQFLSSSNWLDYHIPNVNNSYILELAENLSHKDIIHFLKLNWFI